MSLAVIFAVGFLAGVLTAAVMNALGAPAFVTYGACALVGWHAGRAVERVR